MQDEARSLLWQDGAYEARVTWQQEADPSRLAQAAARLLAALAGQDAAPPCPAAHPGGGDAAVLEK